MNHVIELPDDDGTIFDGAYVPNDAIRCSRWSEEAAIEGAKRMKKYLIDKHECRLRRKWVPAE